MASRNERKRRAREKRLALERAVQEALRLEHERQRAKALNVSIDLEALGDCEVSVVRSAIGDPRVCRSNERGKGGSRAGRTAARFGKVVKGKFVATEPVPFEPLKHDGNSSGYGQKRKRYI